MYGQAGPKVGVGVAGRFYAFQDDGMIPLYFTATSVNGVDFLIFIHSDVKAGPRLPQAVVIIGAGMI
jgi:hypothetical protein